MRYENSYHSASSEYPCHFLKVVSRHTHRPANTYHVYLIKNLPYRESKVEEKHKLIPGDLFDDDLYLVCVISIFATFEIGGLIRT